MNHKAKELERKAKILRQSQKRKKLKLIKTKVNRVESKPKLIKFIIHARARKPIIREDESLVDAVKWILSMIPKDDLYEIHDANDRLLWGRSTGLNKKIFEMTHI